MCGPVCTIGLSGGLWLSKVLGISDLTLGLWSGALILSLSLQLYKFLLKKKKMSPIVFWLILCSTWLVTFLFSWNKINWGDTANYFCGAPKIISGSLLGMILLFGSDWLNNLLLKKFHNNKVYFPYQRVIVPIVVLIIVSIIIEKILC